MARSPVAADSLPTFVQDRPLTLAALAFAARAHDGATRDADGAPFILHPLEVASLRKRQSGQEPPSPRSARQTRARTAAVGVEEPIHHYRPYLCALTGIDGCRIEPLDYQHRVHNLVGCLAIEVGLDRPPPVASAVSETHADLFPTCHSTRVRT